MPRRARTIVGGYAYQMLNRANGRLQLFEKLADFAAFKRVIEEAFERVPLRILCYTLMGNHWHFIVWPRQRQHEQVSEFFRWLAVTHSQRWLDDRFADRWRWRWRCGPGRLHHLDPELRPHAAIG